MTNQNLWAINIANFTGKLKIETIQRMMLNSLDAIKGKNLKFVRMKRMIMDKWSLRIK